MLTKEEKLAVYDQIQDLRSFAIWAEFFNLYTRGRGLESDKELAKLLAVTPATISYWRNGHRLPNMEQVYCICTKLNLARGERQNLIFAHTLQGMIKNMIKYVELALADGRGKFEVKMANAMIAQMLGDLGYKKEDLV